MSESENVTRMSLDDIQTQPQINSISTGAPPGGSAPVSEDFRHSQFWYNEKTGRALAQAAIDHSSNELKIAFVSAPAAYRDLFKIQCEKEGESMGGNVYIFEYDHRFGGKYCNRLCFYNYTAPTDQPVKFHQYVLVEPRRRAAWCLFVGVQRSPYAQILFGGAKAYKGNLAGPLVSRHQTIFISSPMYSLEISFACGKAKDVVTREGKRNGRWVSEDDQSVQLFRRTVTTDEALEGAGPRGDIASAECVQVCDYGLQVEFLAPTGKTRGQLWDLQFFERSKPIFN
ncbi:LOW QUALITY PROTEIN: N(6)-adenine-specific DNA methyltransferase 2 [Phytophthora megakarya]|uniref:N(6)-adenine-specific DNA methyltransferase 2 n=1 Tax=Phytophthora megakarya TaxID=4795 RepID=A0A225WGU0_9STRA|nr:LOW QUALITY PROTEIN: N(6)-adenine-specific DNA methyltransferase 2 [Phytophthora megakarya]